MNTAWAIIFGGMILAAIASIFFLWSRFCKFGIIRKISGDKKWLKRVLGLIPMLVLGIFAWIDTVNTAIIMIHMSICWIIVELIALLTRKICGRKHEEKNGDFGSVDGKFRPYAVGIIVIIIEVCYFTVGWYLAHNVWETSYTVTTDKEIGKDGLKIAFFADSHVGALFDGEGFAEHLQRIQATEPDILLIPGDFVDDDTTKDDMIRCCEALSGFTCKYGKYFVYGNHDKGYYQYRNFNSEELRNELEKAGVIILEDEYVLVDDKFYIVGRQDMSVEDRKNIQGIISDIDTSKYMIVLDHQPTDYAAEAAAEVDLVLSGHTHGGQLIEMKLASLLMGANDRTYGTEKREKTDFIVTSGIADWAIKFKTGTKSEYCIVNVIGK